jgi:hypothetical protein
VRIAERASFRQVGQVTRLNNGPLAQAGLIRSQNHRYGMAAMRLARLGTSAARLAAFAALGTAGLLVAPGGPALAAAATPTPTQIANFTATPTMVSYPDPVIAVSGVLETAESPPQPLPKTLILVFYAQGPGGQALNIFTNSSGQFSFKVTEVVPAPIVVSFGGDSQYGPTSRTANVTAPVYPAKIVLDPIPPTPAYSIADITGTLLMQLPDNSWVPSPLAPIRYVQGSDLRTFTDQNGRFTISAGAYPGQSVTISTPAPTQDTFWWSGAATTGPFYVPLTVDPTAVCGAIGSDQSPSPADSIGFTIHTCFTDAAGGDFNYAGPVQLFFRPAAGGNWTLMASATTASNGFAHVTVSGYLAGGALAAGSWKWVVPAEPGFGASGSGPFTVVISVPTKISGLRFGLSGTQERLTGRLSYRTAGVARAAVVIKHFVGGRWRNVATVQTSSAGRFAYRFSRRLTGRYRVLYRGAPLPGAEASFGSFESTLSGIVRFG